MTYQIIKNFLTYSAGSVFLKLITGIISFLLINFLSPAEFGLLGLVNNFINIFPLFLNLGLRQTYSINFFHLNHEQKKEMISDIIFIYLLFSLPLLTLANFSFGYINKYIFYDQANYLIIFLILAISFLHFFTEMFFQTLRYFKKASQLSLIQICMSLIYLIASVILIYFYKFKIIGVIVANLISMIFVSLYAFYLYFKKISLFKVNLNLSKCISYLNQGLPFIPSILFNWLMLYSGKWILLNYSSLHEVGIYSFADSFGQLYQTLILYPLTSAYMPYIFEQFNLNKDNIKKIQKLNSRYMSIFMVATFIFISFGFFIFKNLFYLILPQKFFISVDYIWLVLLGQIIFSGTFFLNCYLQYLKRTWIFSGLIIFSSIINILLNFLLVPYYFIYGTLIALIIAYIVYFVSILAVIRLINK